MTDPRLSVIICAYTMARWDQLVEAVASVHAQSTPAAEVVVVVDHNDELLERAGAVLADAATVVLPNTQRRGLAGARNTGVEAATGEVVVFLDDDARAAPRWLEEMSKHYRDPTVIGVGGLVVPLWASGAPDWFPPEFGWVVGCSYTGQPEHTAVVRNPIGANMSFRRDPVLAVGGFRVEVGRVGADALGGEETELSIRLAQHHPGSRILHEPAAVVHHHVPGNRGRWAYFRRRCWAEGLSKAQVSRLSDPTRALGSERAYVRRALPLGVARDVRTSVADRDLRSLARAGAIVAGLALTVGGYTTGTARTRRTTTQDTPENTMQGHQMPASGWLNFDIHGKVGIQVAARAPGAPQLRAMLACFATDREVPADIVVSERPEPMPDAALLEHELAYTETAVRFVRERVQLVLEEDQYRVHGAGELLTSLVPVLDRAMVNRGAAMIHAATVAYQGQAIALPAAGGTGKTSTMAKLMRREGWTFMGDDWAFLSDDAQLLGYEKPMFIKPHHKDDLPAPVRRGPQAAGAGAALPRRGPGHHRGAPGRDPLPPGGRPLPAVVARSTGWSRRRRRSPGASPTTAAPLAAAVYLERFEGARSRLVEKDPEWMVDRMLGNFHIEMASFSQQVVTGLAASSVLPWTRSGRGQGDGAAQGPRRAPLPPAAGAQRLHPGRGLRRHRRVPRGAAALARRHTDGVARAHDPSPAGGGDGGRPRPQRRSAAAGVPGLAARVRRRPDRRRRRTVERRLAGGRRALRRHGGQRRGPRPAAGPGRSVSRRRRPRWVLLVDADVVFPEGALDQLLVEYDAGGYAALQAGLESVSGPGYWGRALAHHHRTGRSRHWFGLVATLCDREDMLPASASTTPSAPARTSSCGGGCATPGLQIGVSRSVMVEHRFAGDDFAFAMDQFSMDGFGLGRMMRKHGGAGLRLAALPAAAAARGVALSVAPPAAGRGSRYFTVFAVANYTGMVRGLRP